MRIEREERKLEGGVRKIICEKKSIRTTARTVKGKKKEEDGAKIRVRAVRTAMVKYTICTLLCG
jgi:hypothetical protein